MKLNFSFKTSFKINGKEYNSTEEMPDDVRAVFKKAMASQADAGPEIKPAAGQRKIIFNGTEYDSLEAIPQEVRQLYEKAIKQVEAVTPAEGGAPLPGDRVSGHKIPGHDHPADSRNPTKTESSFSPRALLIGAVAAALILLLYYLIRG